MNLNQPTGRYNSSVREKYTNKIYVEGLDNIYSWHTKNTKDK